MNIEPNISSTHTHNNTIKKQQQRGEEKNKTLTRQTQHMWACSVFCCLNITASYSWRRFACARNNQVQINKEMPKEKKIQIHAFYIHFFFSLSLRLFNVLYLYFYPFLFFTLSLVEPQLNAFAVTCSTAERMHDSFEEFYLKRHFQSENPIVSVCSGEIEKVHLMCALIRHTFCTKYTNPIGFFCADGCCCLFSSSSSLLKLKLQKKESKLILDWRCKCNITHIRRNKD